MYVDNIPLNNIIVNDFFQLIHILHFFETITFFLNEYTHKKAKQLNVWLFKLVPPAGLEPAWPYGPRDFKSLMSANFITVAFWWIQFLVTLLSWSTVSTQSLNTFSSYHIILRCQPVLKIWWVWRESNPHAFRHSILSAAWLPLHHIPVNCDRGGTGIPTTSFKVG